MDRGLHAANLLLLFTTAALAFPTDVVATELQADAWGTDAKVAVVLYAALAAAMCLSWAALYHHLHRRPELLEGTSEPTYVRHGSLRSWIGALAYALAGVLGVLVTPLAALGAFVLLPVFYFTTSEGLPGSQDAPDEAAA